MDNGPRTHQRYRRLVVFGLIALVIGAAVGAWLALPSYVEDRVRRSLDRVSKALGSEVHVEAIETKRAQTIVLRGVTIRDSGAAADEPPVLMLGEVESELDRLSVIFSKPRLVAVRVRDPELIILRRADGTDNVEEPRAKFSGG